MKLKQYTKVHSNTVAKIMPFLEKCNRKTVKNLQFSIIWKSTYYSYIQPHRTGLPFKLLHNITKTNHCTYQCSWDKADLNPSCDYCHKTEDNLHLFTSCHRIQNIWKNFKPTYNKLTKKHHKLEQHMLTLSSNVKNPKCKK